MAYSIGVIEVLEDCPLHLNGLLVTIKQSYDKIEEVALAHIVWWLLLKLSNG